MHLCGKSVVFINVLHIPNRRNFEANELHWSWTRFGHFTSMFVERLEVLEYRQKFKVELSAFPATLLTLTRQENWVLARRARACVCVCLSVCVCEKVCQWISYVRVDRLGWKLRCVSQLATNREPPLNSTIGLIFPSNLKRGGDFCNSLNPYI